MKRILSKFLQFFIPPLYLDDEIEDRLAWLILLRWLVFTGQLIVVSVAIKLQFVSPNLAVWLYSLILFLGFTNFLACYSLNQRKFIFSGSRRLLAWMLIDLMQFLLLISLNQGIQNPFYPLIYVHAVLGAIFLPIPLSWAFLTMLALGLYMLNPVVYVFNSQQTFVRLSALVAWAIQFGILTALWTIAGSVSRRLISWREQAESLRYQQQSLQKIHLLGALGAGVAHEFATPLNTLRMRLERLRRQQVTPDLDAAMKALEQCEERLKNMAALPNRSDLNHIKPLQIEVFLKTQLSQWQHHWPEINLQTAFDLPTQFEVNLPELALKQAISNLLDNAAQAMQGAGKIQLTVKLDKQVLCLSVQDQGPGFADSVLEHFGEPFISTRQEGTGLGLYTVQLLTLALGGTIELANQDGAHVQIQLPIG